MILLIVYIFLFHKLYIQSEYLKIICKLNNWIDWELEKKIKYIIVKANSNTFCLSNCSNFTLTSVFVVLSWLLFVFKWQIMTIYLYNQSEKGNYNQVMQRIDWGISKREYRLIIWENKSLSSIVLWVILILIFFKIACHC